MRSAFLGSFLHLALAFYLSGAVIQLWSQTGRTTMPGSASLPIGMYKLDVSINGLAGLTEFSQAEYEIYGRRFEGEKSYNAPALDFLRRRWKVALGAVGGKVYKIVCTLNPRARIP
jgi:hypothetical protein